MNLPENLAEACKPLFERVPLEEAMPELLHSNPKHTALVEQILQTPALADRPELASALWLYVDDLDRSHTLSQSLPDPTGAYWHGIMHRREGDFSNSHYWMRRAAHHPLFQTHPELDSDGLIDAVARTRTSNAPDLVARQRAEWMALFEWCANNS